MREVIKAAFPFTIPVMLGYVPMGMGYGILMVSSGYGLLWSAGSSILIFSGTGQFVSVNFLTAGVALLQVALIIIILNSRMMFYGLSFLDKWNGMGWRKWYMIHALTDETYAVLNTAKPPEGMDKQKFMFAIAMMDQSYWVIGTILGAIAGSLLTIDTTGIDFMMTALFIVLCMDQWKAYKTHEPVFEGLVCSILSLVIFGPDNFMVPSLLAILVILLVRRQPIEKKQAVEQEVRGENI